MVIPLGILGSIPSSELVVVSDVHLREPDDSRSQILINLIGQLGQDTEYFVLNGDIFDFCFGPGPYWQEKYHALSAALERAAKKGIKIIFIEGNHEFHMSEFNWSGVQIVKDNAIVLELKSGTKIKIGHGDLITGEKSYAAFRSLIKSRFIRAVAKSVPSAWLDAYALRHAKVSRSQDKYRKLDHHHILRSFSEFLRDGDYHHGIIGHFHVPYAEKRETTDGLLLSVESWDKPNALTFHKGNFYRVFFEKNGAGSKIEAAESIFKEGTQH